MSAPAKRPWTWSALARWAGRAEAARQARSWARAREMSKAAGRPKMWFVQALAIRAALCAGSWAVELAALTLVGLPMLALIGVALVAVAGPWRLAGALGMARAERGLGAALEAGLDGLDRANARLMEGWRWGAKLACARGPLAWAREREDARALAAARSDGGWAAPWRWLGCSSFALAGAAKIPAGELPMGWPGLRAGWTSWELAREPWAARRAGWPVGLYGALRLRRAPWARPLRDLERAKGSRDPRQAAELESWLAWSQALGEEGVLEEASRGPRERRSAARRL